MAASMARDLRMELEQMMQLQLKSMLLTLEERLARAVVEGGVVVSEQPQERPGAALFKKSATQSTGYQRMLPSGGLDRDMNIQLSARPSSAREVYAQVATTEEGQGVLDEEELVKAQRYKLNFGTLIMLIINGICDAWEVDYQARNNTDQFPTWYKWIQLFLCIGFAAEFAKRVSFEGAGFFYKGARLSWHYFQFMLTAGQVVEMTLILKEWWFGYSFSFSGYLRPGLRLVSTIRIMRVFHILDHLDMATELHLLLASMQGSLRSLCWSALFMLIPMFVFGIALTQAVADFRVSSGNDHSKMEGLTFYYGTLDRAILTLFISISGGLSWSEAMFPLRDNGFVIPCCFFMFYVAIMIFAVLNILTGVFVSSAQSAATSEKEKSMLTLLKRVFNEADADGSGNLTKDEFNQLLLHPDIGVCLQALNITTFQATQLFDLIDQDGSGCVASDEFLEGLDKYQGSMKSIDFATFGIEFQSLRADVSNLKRMAESGTSRPMSESEISRPMGNGGTSWSLWPIACQAPSR